MKKNSISCRDFFKKIFGVEFTGEMMDNDNGKLMWGMEKWIKIKCAILIQMKIYIT